jgi:peptidoglycan/LPS O-acetylase OafA/YrhL
LNFIPYRESTPFWRLLTGFLFGYTTAWFGYPLVEETMAETRKIMSKKLARYKRAQAEKAQPLSAD